jgi:hypothetical protein
VCWGDSLDGDGVLLTCGWILTEQMSTHLGLVMDCASGEWGPAHAALTGDFGEGGRGITEVGGI